MLLTVEHSSYVGLVNQAMTCYLNSLLQALYMTPEFRNALYNWEFDGANETRSIPYQLQKLFLNLQTSSKSAVETTDLTTSFGWQGKMVKLFILCIFLLVVLQAVTLGTSTTFKNYAG